MIKTYFNIWEAKRVLKYAETDPLRAKEEYETYLEKYPRDYITYTFYANVLIILGHFDEAEKVLDYAKKLYEKNGRFYNDLAKMEYFEKKLIWDTLRLLSYQEKYEELYNFYSQNYGAIKNIGIKSIDTYYRKKSGRLNMDRDGATSYLTKQIIKYDEKEFLDHIKKHLQDCDDDIEKSTGVFYEDFPLNEVVEEIKKHIPSNKKLCYGFFDDTYIFKYDECGRDNNKSVNYFKVVCLHNTNDFITMFPSVECENLPYTNLNYFVKDKKEVKVKRLSQIEKFNNKYNKK